MTITDYLIDQANIDWASLLAPFHWLIPREFTVWLVNRYGDVVFVRDDGSVHMLDIGRGTVTTLAASRDEFATLLDEHGNAADWLMIPLVDRCVAAGLFLRSGQCYTYRQPPVLGGDYTVANTTVTTLLDHYAFYGALHDRIKDLADGEKVHLDLRRDA